MALGLVLLGALAGCAGPDGPAAAVRPVVVADGMRLEAATGGLYEQGKNHLEAGRYGLAVTALREALAREPRSVPVLNALAIAYGELGRDDLALRFFEQALAQDTATLQTANNVGYWALRRARLDLARRYLERAAALAPEDATVRANLALLAAREHGAAAPPLPDAGDMP
jgi:Flp pilus assembly protein TadD